MKKTMAWLIGLMMILTAAGACAESAEPDFETLSGLSWCFCSGVGAWSTDLRMQPDGSFSGEYHDSEMGESADEYPDGTVYGCSFAGKMSFVGQADENAWIVRVDSLTLDEGQVPEAIEDGIRFVTAGPYGLSEGDEMLLYRPGTPVIALSEEMLLWAHVLDRETPPEALETWLLYSEKNDSGFVGEPAWTGDGIANPWQDLTAEELLAASGLSFGVPEGAENVIYRFLPAQNLAEMQFTMDGDDFCARLQSVSFQDGELYDISGMYFDWQNEEAITVRGCRGIIGQAQCGSEDWVERCLWADETRGLAGSLSVSTVDPDGLDLAAVAEMICLR